MKKLHKLLISFFTLVFFLTANTLSFSEISRFRQFVYPEYSKKISMDFKDADLRSVLKIFSQQAGMNFIAASDVADAKVTLFFQNVPVEEALDRILSANGLMYEIESGSDIFTVKKVTRPSIDLVTRVYTLRHATVPKSMLLSTLTQDDNISSGSAAMSPAISGSSSNNDDKEDDGLIAALKSILSENGKIIEDPRTNSLIVTDIPSQFPIIERTIAKLDVPIPQILIEVEMLDISKNTAEQMGVKYGTTLTFTGAKRATFYPWDQNNILSKGRAEFDPAAGGALPTAEYVAGAIDASGLTMMIQFLKTQTDTKNLANPKILTLNNQSAEIKISTDESIGIVSTTSGGGSGITSSAVEAERVQTGVFLTVTPQANVETGEITLAIIPKVVDAQQGGVFMTPNGLVSFKDPEERTSKAVLRVKDNETVFLGGLKRNNKTDIVTKVPLLGDIPWIGGAFRHKDKVSDERELVIFITPKIIDDRFHVTPKTLTDNSIVREQDFSVSKSREIEKALLITEQQRLKK